MIRVSEPTVHYSGRYTMADFLAEVRGAIVKRRLKKCLSRIWEDAMTTRIDWADCGFTVTESNGFVDDEMR